MIVDWYGDARHPGPLLPDPDGRSRALQTGAGGVTPRVTPAPRQPGAATEELLGEALALAGSPLGDLQEVEADRHRRRWTGPPGSVARRAPPRTSTGPGRSGSTGLEGEGLVPRQGPTGLRTLPRASCHGRAERACRTWTAQVVVKARTHGSRDSSDRRRASARADSRESAPSLRSRFWT